MNPIVQGHVISIMEFPILIKQYLYTGSAPGPSTNNPHSKVHGANMGPTWVLSAPDGPHVGPMNLAIREWLDYKYIILPSNILHCWLRNPPTLLSGSLRGMVLCNWYKWFQWIKWCQYQSIHQLACPRAISHNAHISFDNNKQTNVWERGREVCSLGPFY